MWHVLEHVDAEHVVERPVGEREAAGDVLDEDIGRGEFGRDVEPLVAHTRREERAQPTVPAPDVEHGRAGRDAGERARLTEPHPLLAAAAPGTARAVERGQLGRRRTDLRAHGPSKDRKSTRLNSSHLVISYAVFCLKK